MHGGVPDRLSKQAALNDQKRRIEGSIGSLGNKRIDNVEGLNQTVIGSRRMDAMSCSNKGSGDRSGTRRVLERN